MEQFIKDPKYTRLEKEKENERQSTRYYVLVQVEIKKGPLITPFSFSVLFLFFLLLLA